MVEVIYDGNLGNNLFQYCFGRILALKLGYTLKANPIDGFPGTSEKISGKDYSKEQKIYLRGQKVDLSFLENKALKAHIILTGYFQRYEYYQDYRTEIREWLKMDDFLYDEIGENDLVIGVRRGKDYIPQHGLPLSYYEKAIQLTKHDRVFICSNTNDQFIKYIQKKHNAIVRPPGAIDNILFIKKFKKIIISNSTFLWWAAYLSDATEIYFPRPQNGFWAPNEPISKNIQLEVLEDSRYIYLEADKYRPQFLNEMVGESVNGAFNVSKKVVKKIFPFLKKKNIKEGIVFHENFE
ncbi:MAG: alpha-1,2-fucosyltransferase [Haliscomenobacter sp.]|uniref:alpha-1,2-fucosyltransferase n=1 Tax=Haliscomenobacter sp. TaxID=2717303 RepID=UPI0029A0151A|nr:alpha-1,2-fucosyltransferase [Haliscomenobacter sp.]MDX2067865.1 alpha-1,2-fucosyltransferase [Haliscomenobacter sp.]